MVAARLQAETLEIVCVELVWWRSLWAASIASEKEKALVPFFPTLQEWNPFACWLNVNHIFANRKNQGIRFPC